MYTEYHIFTVLPIKDLINKDGKLTTPFKLATGTKPSVSNLCVLFCPCAVRKATTHVDKKALNMRHRAQKGFHGIFIGITQHQKGYLVYVPSTRNIISSYVVVFYEIFLSVLAYMSRLYSEAMSMLPDVTYIPYATSSKEKTGDIITFTQFEEGNLLSENREDAEIGDKSDDYSIVLPLISKEEMDTMDYGDKLDDEPMSKDILEYIQDGSQYRLNVNRR